MNLQGQNFGGYMEYGRSVLLRRDPCLRQRPVQPTVFIGELDIVQKIPLFTPPIVPNGVLYLCKSH
jgi:hypothetical protein